jgi:MYXO-CTERM domain-containing protein
LHDVGTITASTGTHAGEPLLGLDTPTLLGVWSTPPYLHDGSAPTLRDVLTTKNPSGLHGFVSSLSAPELDQLVSYLQQIDNEDPVRRLPFDPPPVAGGAGGQGGAGTTGGAGLGSGAAMALGGGAGMGSTAGGGAVTPAPPAGAAPHDGAGCGCKLASADRTPFGAVLATGLLGLAALRFRRRRASRERGRSSDERLGR